MNEVFRQSMFVGVTISLIAYEIGLFLKKKFGLAVLNPLLVSIIIVIIALKGLGISYEVYNASAKYISYLLTPATVCLAVPLYEQLELLKKKWLQLYVEFYLEHWQVCLGFLFFVCCLDLIINSM